MLLDYYYYKLLYYYIVYNYYNYNYRQLSIFRWTNTLDVKGNATMTIEFLHSDDRPVADVKPIIREIPEVILVY